MMSDRERFIELMESFGIEVTIGKHAVELEELCSLWYFDKNGKFESAHHV